MASSPGAAYADPADSGSAVSPSADSTPGAGGTGGKAPSGGNPAVVPTGQTGADGQPGTGPQ